MRKKSIFMFILLVLAALASYLIIQKRPSYGTYTVNHKRSAPTDSRNG